MSALRDLGAQSDLIANPALGIEHVAYRHRRDLAHAHAGVEGEHYSGAVAGGMLALRDDR
jgi:hypothetical protein